MEYSTPLQNFLNHSASQPNKVFLHQPVNRQWQEFTWQEVESQARRIASALKAQGYETGGSLLEKEKIEYALEMINKAKEKDVQLLLPVDNICGDTFSNIIAPYTATGLVLLGLILAFATSRSSVVISSISTARRHISINVLI